MFSQNLILVTENDIQKPPPVPSAFRWSAKSQFVQHSQHKFSLLPSHSLPYAGRPGPYASCMQGEENLCAWSCCKRVVENVGALENRWCVRADRKPKKSVQAPTKTGMALNRKSVFEVGSRVHNLENDTVSLPPSGWSGAKLLPVMVACHSWEKRRPAQLRQKSSGAKNAQCGPHNWGSAVLLGMLRSNYLRAEPSAACCQQTNTRRFVTATCHMSSALSELSCVLSCQFIIKTIH